MYIKNMEKKATRSYIKRVQFESEEDYQRFIKARRKGYNRKYYIPRRKDKNLLIAGENILEGSSVVIVEGQVFVLKRI